MYNVLVDDDDEAFCLHIGLAIYIYWTLLIYDHVYICIYY